MNMKIALDEGAIMPTRAYCWDAGLDLYSREDAYIQAHSKRSFNTGVHVQVPPGFAGFVKSRSGMMKNLAVVTDGTIDPGYTGAVEVILFNHGYEPVKINAGDRIAQLVLVECAYPDLEKVDKLDESHRGNDGFGSTGR